MQHHSQWAEQTPKIRQNILKMIHAAKSGHPGGSLSLVEILMTLWGSNGVMDVDHKNPYAEKRDRFVLSKGHGVPALYAILAELGIEVREDELMTLRQLNSRLQGHPDRVRLPIVEASTGSLGQGASIAQGLAMTISPQRTYCVIGDGEMQEGQIWEVALSAAHHKVSNLTLILDANGGQIDGPVEEVLSLGNVEEKMRAFGWHCQTVDGHSYAELEAALKNHHPEKPHFIWAKTIKGKGVSFMENNIGWHGKATNEDELNKALQEVANKSIGL